VGVERDFASLLDDLIEKRGEAGDMPGAAPSLRFDMLEQIERLRAENPDLAVVDSRQDYLDMMAHRAAPAPHRVERAAPLAPVDREAVASELGISQRMSRVELDRIRRDFARSNHPDRVAIPLRQRAMIRMQLANMLIDEARDRLPRN
jgi:hypothetical protein